MNTRPLSWNGRALGKTPRRAPDYVPRCFKNTLNFWRAWIGRSTYQGRWREMVNRAALTLKLLVSQPYGSLVAAPTFGLPERLGGERNWGLPLYLDPGRVVYALCAESLGLHRRDGRLYAMD